MKNNISIKQLFFLGLQHVLAMYAGAVMVPLVLGNSLQLSYEQISFLISADLFTCGIATIIQAKGLSKYIGINLPVIMGCSFTAVAPMIIIGKNFGILYIFGSVICAGFFLFCIAPFFKIFLKFFPPIVIGSIIILIGLTLIPITMNNIFDTEQNKLLKNIIISCMVLIFIVVMNKYFSGFLKNISILLSLIIGTFFSYFLGMVDFSCVSQEKWFNIIKPFYFGFPKFSVNGTLVMILISLISAIESIGVFFTLGKICQQDMTDQRIIKGLKAEAVSQILGGIFNSFPYTTYSQNIGLVVLTKAKEYTIGISAGLILIMLGLIPKFSALVTIIPKPVLGSAMIPLIGLVVVYGIKILQTADLNNMNNMMIIAISLSIGLGITLNQSYFELTPTFLKILLSNGVIIGSIISIVLNIFINNKEIWSNKK